MPRVTLRHIFVGLLFACSVLRVSADDAPSVIKFDGLYCADDVDGFMPPVASYLRFYPDGIVVSMATRDVPDDAAKWIRRDDRFSSQGRYAIKGVRLTFSLAHASGGAVDYVGAIDGDELLLSWDAHKGEKGKEVYRFVRLALPTQ
jgi:hypothetical protein